MGASFSSPQLGGGLVSVPSDNASISFPTAFYVDASDTNLFGFSATMTQFGTSMQVQYTDTSNVPRSAPCTRTVVSYWPVTSVTDGVTNTYSDYATAVGSILCQVPNTQIGPGTVTLSLHAAYGSPCTSAIYVSRTTALTVSEPTTTTMIVPRSTTYLKTVASTNYETTKTVAITETLIGQHPASRCPSSRASSSTRLSTSTRSLVTSSGSPKDSSSIRTRAISTSSSFRTSILPKISSSSNIKPSSMISKSSSSKIGTTPASSRTASRSTSSKAISKTMSSKVSSISSVCSTGAALESLSSYPSVASHLCQDILSTTQTFPSSISVWPASQLSSACSCYATSSRIEVSASLKASLNRRITEVEASPVSSDTTTPTSVTGYGPPTIYSGSIGNFTTIDVHTVYITQTPATSTTTATISAGTTTITANSTVTIDQRTLPTTCLPNGEVGLGTLSARSSTCMSLELHTAFVWVMMKDPFDFCAYFLTANGNTSPLLEMSASTLKDTCNCLVVHKSAPLPVFPIGASYSPEPKRQCNMSVASLLKAKFKEPKTFCEYYTSTSRSISPFSILQPGDVFAGCSCLTYLT